MTWARISGGISPRLRWPQQVQVRACPWCSVTLTANSGSSATCCQVGSGQSEEASEGKGVWQWVQIAGTYGTILVTRSGGRRWRWRPGCPGCPPGLRPVGALMTGLGAPGGSTEGGEGEFDELRFNWERSSWISACKSAICLRASSNCPRATSKVARSWPHSGQEATGLATGSFMYDEHTQVARNCNVINDRQALSSIIHARRGTGRLLTYYNTTIAHPFNWTY